MEYRERESYFVSTVSSDIDRGIGFSYAISWRDSEESVAYSFFFTHGELRSIPCYRAGVQGNRNCKRKFCISSGQYDNNSNPFVLSFLMRSTKGLRKGCSEMSNQALIKVRRCCARNARYRFFHLSLCRRRPSESFPLPGALSFPATPWQRFREDRQCGYCLPFWEPSVREQSYMAALYPLRSMAGLLRRLL